MFSLRKNVFFMLRFRSTHLWKILIILGRLVWFLSFKLGRGQKEIFRRLKVCVCCWWDPERDWIDFVIEVLHAVFSRKNKPDFGKYIDVVYCANVKRWGDADIKTKFCGIQWRLSWNEWTCLLSVTSGRKAVFPWGSKMVQLYLDIPSHYFFQCKY